MKALQMLMRLKQIEGRLAAIGVTYPHPVGSAESNEVNALRDERAAILAQVNQPPEVLRDEPAAEHWAEEFERHFPRVAAAEVFPWFSGAMGAAFVQGAKVPRPTMERPGFGEMAEMLRQIRGMLDTRQVRCAPLKCNDSGEVFSLADLIDRTLRAAEVTP